MQEQNHPRYLNDREIVNRLLPIESPSSEDLIELARLFIRYEGFPGAQDLKADLLKLLKLWSISRGQLNLKVQEIWSRGYRPGEHSDEDLGSGFDVTESENA